MERDIEATTMKRSFTKFPPPRRGQLPEFFRHVERRRRLDDFIRQLQSGALISMLDVEMYRLGDERWMKRMGILVFWLMKLL